MIIVLIYVIIKERAMLGCHGVFEDCDNYKGKPFLGTNPTPSDSIEELFKKLTKASAYTRQVVYWRRSYLLAFIIVLVVFWISYVRWPSERELVVGMFIVFAVVYFSFNFYQFHLNFIAEQRINSISSIIQEKIDKFNNS